MSSNVINLAELQKRADSSEAREPDEILRDLDGLGDEPNLVQIKALTGELVTVLGDETQLTVAMAREKYVQLLGGKLKSPTRIFDAALAGRTPSLAASGQEQGRALILENPDPWPDPVEGAEILGEVQETFRRFVVLGEAELTVLALWVAHTYGLESVWITPRLAITSPEKRCGKTLVLTLLRHLVAKPLMTANASPAAIFRCVESVRPTLLIDEADTFLGGKDELRGILNSGHQRDGCVLRTVGDDHEPRTFSTFSPAAIAMIGGLPDTLADRAVAVRMARKKVSERVERLRTDRLGPFEDLRRRALRWVSDTHQVLEQADPEVPNELNDRAADNWRCLLAIADAAGGSWPAAARQAALETSSSKGEDLSAGVRLLEDLQSIFERGGVGRAFSRDIVAKLIGMEDRPWPEWKAGKPLTLRQLAMLLQPFGIKPRQVRIGTETLKGYRLEDCEDAFERYLVDPNRNIRNTPVESTVYETPRSETPGDDVSVCRAHETPDSMRDVSDVSDRQREVVKL